MSGDPIRCQCPLAWWGTVPPVCPVHNPATYTVFGAPAAPRLSDDDIERIAQRVAEMLKADR